MNFFITGGSGFIGVHLANLIKEEYPDSKIYNLDIEKQEEKHLRLKNYNSPIIKESDISSEYIYCDVRKKIDELPVSVSEDDILIHLAAIHQTPGYEDYEYFETNIRGAENVVDFAERYGIHTVVFMSSISVYGTSESMKEEEDLPMPNTPYGISKLVSEEIFKGWQKGASYRKLVVLRPGVVFGKGENGNFTRMYWAIRKHRFAYPGRKDTIKACIYVKDLVRFVLFCIKKTENQQLFNCGYEPSYHLEQIVNAMKTATHTNAFVPYLPNFLIMPTAILLGMLGAPMGICRDRVVKLQISTNVSGKRMSETEFEYKWTLQEALQDWFSDNEGKGLW